ncbi:MAG: Lrp/AsnC family transcriptional regulator [Chromatiales bacterium]|jgi:DNA-binding Lrp family transcriptional regulator
MTTREYSALERRLLNDFQRGLPLDPRPFAVVAERLGVDERQVIEALERLQGEGAVSRVGPVLAPNRIGASTLAAMAVPPERLDEVAALVSDRPEVNHNYQRDHEINLWFVIAAGDRAAVDRCLGEIEDRTGLAVLDLPMLEDYFIDLGFDLRWT